MGSAADGSPTRRSRRTPAGDGEVARAPQTLVVVAKQELRRLSNTTRLRAAGPDADPRYHDHDHDQAIGLFPPSAAVDRLLRFGPRRPGRRRRRSLSVRIATTGPLSTPRSSLSPDPSLTRQCASAEASCSPAARFGGRRRGPRRSRTRRPGRHASWACCSTPPLSARARPRRAGRSTRRGFVIGDANHRAENAPRPVAGIPSIEARSAPNEATRRALAPMRTRNQTIAIVHASFHQDGHAPSARLDGCAEHFCEHLAASTWPGPTTEGSRSKPSRWSGRTAVALSLALNAPATDGF